jgi:hypothetical protein
MAGFDQSKERVGAVAWNYIAVNGLMGLWKVSKDAHGDTLVEPQPGFEGVIAPNGVPNAKAAWIMAAKEPGPDIDHDLHGYSGYYASTFQRRPAQPGGIAFVFERSIRHILWGGGEPSERSFEPFKTEEELRQPSRNQSNFDCCSWSR